nr:hypothetical protein Iba_chr14bCG8600 [Ipomoea batatas]
MISIIFLLLPVSSPSRPHCRQKPIQTLIQIKLSYSSQSATPRRNKGRNKYNIGVFGMSSQIVSSSSNMTIYGENAGTNSSESDWNYEQNCSDGEFDNNEIRDDMDFETHVDPLLEAGGMKPRKRTLKPSEPIQIFIEEQQGTPTSEQQEDIPTTEQLHGIPTTEEYASIPVNEEQNIMTQEDIDFMSMFDFSTPFEENPTPFQELHVIVEEHIGSASTIQQNEHGVRMCYGIPQPLKKFKKPTQG